MTLRRARLREPRRLDHGPQHVRADAGPRPDDGWKGWWGSNPPYHVPVFVLTHHARAPIVMEGGTTFYFVTDGIHAALKRARRRLRARMSGWAVVLPPSGSTSPQELIDELHLAISPCSWAEASTSSPASIR